MPTFFLAMLDDEDDKIVFLRLHKEYTSYVLHIANRFFSDSTVAEEIASSVWFLIAKSFNSIRHSDAEKFKHLLYIMVKNVARNTQLKDEKRIKPFPLEGDVPDDAPSAYNVLLSHELKIKVEKGLNSLDEVTRDIIILRFALDKKPNVISKLLSLPIETVYKSIRRGADNLKRLWKDESGFE